MLKIAVPDKLNLGIAGYWQYFVVCEFKSYQWDGQFPYENH